MSPLLSPKLLKIALVSYAVKTLLVGIAWLAVPDLPKRAMDKAKQTWSWVSGAKTEAIPVPAPSEQPAK